MSSSDQPVSMKVKVTSQMDATNALSYEAEFVVTTEEEAEQKGDQFRRLMGAFSAGFAEES